MGEDGSNEGTTALETWFEGLRNDPNIINMGRTVGAQFGLGDIECLTAVVDTNVVLAELTWLAKRPGRPVVHVSVPGLANSGILRPICPYILEKEVERHLPRFAALARRSVAELEAIWREYRVYLRFVDVVPTHTPAIRYVQERDPNDGDFVRVQEGFAIDVILTHDNDLKDSPAPTADDPSAILKALRGYEKEKRFTFALVVGGWTFAMSGQISVVGLVRIVRFLWGWFLRLPWWLQLGIGAAAFYGISRLKKEPFIQISSSLRPLLVKLLRDALALAEQGHAAKKRADKAIAAARERVPTRRGRRALVPTVRRALLDSPTGATDAELAKAVLALGYKTTSKNLPAYLRRALRREPGIAYHGGRWHLEGMSAPPVSTTQPVARRS